MMSFNTYRSGALVALLVAAGCSGSDDALFEEILVTEAASESECPDGGLRLVTGEDRDGDGALAEDEITGTEIVCNGGPGDPGDPGDPGAPTLLRTTAEPAGDNCDNGGERVDAGRDDDGDGELGDEEIEVTTYVCRGADGQDGLPLLTRTSTTVDNECGNAGGTRIETGLDADRDGALGDGEVTETQVLCNADDGVQTLIRITPEPAGANCPAGGQRIQSGLDDDGDGNLAGGEVDSETYVCELAAPIVDVTVLAVNTPPCASGGQRIDTGLDLDGNGILEANEVIDTAFACNGLNAVLALTSQSPEPAGVNCPDGGLRVAVGLDDDLDGTLDPAEEDSVSYVCNGAAGQDGATGSAVRLAMEPAGNNCPNGGTRIETGIDANGNGVLDDAEVNATRYACQPASLVSLVDIVPELPGQNCPQGGQRVLSGLDLNEDGTLQPNEVTSTAFVCNTNANVPIRVEPAMLSDGLIDNPYVAQVSAVGGNGGGYQWRVSAGALPPGLTLDPTGTPTADITGTPTMGGTFTFTVEVTDFFGNTDTEDFSIIVAAPFDITSLQVPRFRSGVAYTANLTVDGGQAPLTWSLLEGALPAGLALATNGAITGTPTTSVSTFAVLQVTSNDGRTRRVGLDFSSEPRFLAYCGDVNVDGNDELIVGALDATGAVTTTVSVNFTGGDADCFDQIEFAPGRDAIAFTGEVLSGAEELFVADLSAFPTVTTVRVNPTYTTGDQDVADFEWSPTGNFIGYRADEDINSREELYVADLRNLAAISVVRANGAIAGTSTSLEVTNFQWIPRSDKLVYASDEFTSSEQNLYFYNARTAQPRTQINATLPTNGDANSNYTFSRTGLWMAYSSDERVDNDTECWIVDVSGPTAGTPALCGAPFAADGDVSTGADDLAFSPNGDWLGFTGDGDNLGQELYIFDVRTPANGRTRLTPELTSTAFSTDGFRWAPGSRRVAARGDHDTSGVTELYFLDTEIPGAEITATGPTDAANNDVEFLGDTAAWSPNADYFVYEYDRVVSGADEPYISFVANPTPVRLFANGINDDVNRTVISEDGRYVYTAVDFDGSAILELFVTEIVGGVPSAPVPVNSPSPLGTSQDVDEDFFLLNGGTRVFYFSDEVISDDNEAFLRDISPGPTVGARIPVSSPLPTDGDINGLALQGE